MQPDPDILIADYHDPDHARDLAYLLDCYARDDMGGGQALSPEVKSVLAAELARRPHAVSLLAYVDGAPAGLVNCFEVFSTFRCRPVLNIHDIVVAAEYRGRGLARRLLAAVEQLARERDCCKLTLEVLEGNQVARQAYRSFGFHSYELDPAHGRALFWQKVLD